MQGAGFSLGLLMLAVGAVSAYKVQEFHRRRLGYLSLLQVLYSVVIPLVLVPMFYVYVKSILNKPMSSTVLVKDDILLLWLLLSAMFTYGGILIHGVTKMMAARVNKFVNEDLYSMIRYFHLSFSHNLVYIGVIMLGTSVALLEMNHVFNQEWGVFWALVRGFGMGLSLLLGMFFYQPYRDLKRKESFDKWMTLRLVFVISWVLMFVFWLGIRRVNPVLDTYQMVIPMLVSLALINFFSVLLVVKRLKGRWVMVFSFVRLDRLVKMIWRGEW